MKNLRLRLATLEDLPTLLETEQGIISAERPMDETLAADPIHYYDLAALIQNPKAAVVVVCDGAEIVSTGYALEKPAKVYLDHKSYAYLGFMYTKPEYRGKGLNAKIIAYLKKWAYDRGLDEIRLTVYQTNAPAIRAYEKVGFEKHLIEMRLPRHKEG